MSKQKNEDGPMIGWMDGWMDGWMKLRKGGRKKKDWWTVDGRNEQINKASNGKRKEFIDDLGRVWCPVSMLVAI